jgi:hypothetical protein
MLPDTSLSIVRPSIVVISLCSPRWIIPSSITPATSWPKRTQRVQWMQRAISAMQTSGPASLGKMTRFSSAYRELLAP